MRCRRRAKHLDFYSNFLSRSEKRMGAIRNSDHGRFVMCGCWGRLVAVRYSRAVESFTPASSFCGYNARVKLDDSMNEQRQAQFSVDDGGIASSVSPALIDAQDGRRKRCVQCGGPFGLMRRRRAGKQFCSQKCADQHADGVRKAVAVRARWYAFLYQRK
jgi:hypothetical protein